MNYFPESCDDFAIKIQYKSLSYPLFLSSKFLLRTDNYEKQREKWKDLPESRELAMTSKLMRQK